MNGVPRTPGQWAYALVFCAAIPGGLAWWAHLLGPRLGLPVVRQMEAGIALVVMGVGLWTWSVWSFGRYGRGLPMIGYPPERPIDRGPYRWMNHPIYVAFVLVCAGVSVAAGSVAGFWVVTPLAALGCAALVLGYENDQFAARFPGFARRPRIRLPAGQGEATWGERASVFVLVFIPWLILYESIGHLPVPGAIDARIGAERSWPVWTWTQPVYASTYLAVALVPLVIGPRAVLREFALRGIVATVVVHLLYLAIPLVSPAREFDVEAVFGMWLLSERADGLEGRAAFPAFHVIWTVLAALAMGRAWPRWRLVLWLWVLAVAASCITTGMHAMADVAAAFAVLPVLLRWREVYGWLRRWAERVGNSWREWRIGPRGKVRVISYAGVAFVGAAVGMLIFGACAGAELVGVACVVAVCALVGAGLWGQFWVGAKVARPFGYFGSVLGAGVGIGVVAMVRGMDAGVAWRLSAGMAMCAPWVQAIGRVRCLVNGCCHGRECDAALGIVCTAPMSRIVRLSGLGGRAIHPTPLYSILGNVAIGLFMLRLWRGGDPSLIAGGYLILQSLARFVEENLRGEPHTPRYAGLRLYQWCAMGTLVAGMVVCVLPCGVGVAGAAMAWPVVWGALGIGLVYGLAMGVDFPESKARFSRLA